jgi:hypothetical protein
MKQGIVEDVKGNIFYYKDNGLHRENGPAIIWNDGIQEYYVNNLLHREDGPAIEYPSGKNIWYFKGKKIPVKSQQEFLKYIKLYFLI